LDVANAVLNDTRVAMGTFVRATCNPCYKLEGGGVARCQADGHWSLIPNCVVKGDVFNDIRNDSSLWSEIVLIVELYSRTS